MGFLTQAFRAAKGPNVKPSETPPESWLSDVGLSRSGAGVELTPAQTLQISAVFACCRNIAEDVAKLPLITYRRLSRGKERATNHPLYTLLHDLPNPEMTAMDIRSAMTGHLGTWGNAYAYIDYDGAGRVRELWPLRPDQMFPKRDENGALIYEYYVPGAGTKYVWTMDRVLHVRGLGSDGIMGYSPTALQMRSQGLAWATEEFGSRFFGNGAQPGYAIKHPGQLSDQANKHLKESVEERHTGLEKSHRVMILEEGMDIAKIGIPPEEAQFLETRRFQVTEIARWYRMPPHKIADLEKATFSNIEEQSLEYVTDTLLPWLIRWEQEIKRTLLLPRERGSLFVEHLVDGLLRGKTSERYQAYHLALTDGWLSRNEARERENLNPASGLDEYMVPLNMGPASASARSVEALRPVVEEVAGRLARRQAKDWQAAWAKNPQGFREWLSQAESEWVPVFCAQMLPVMRSYAAMTEQEQAETWAADRALIMARSWWIESFERFDYDKPGDLFVEWQATGAAQLAARMNQWMEAER